MNPARLLDSLQALQAQIDALVDAVKKDGAAANDGTGPAFMSQAEYARRVDKSVTTIRKWVKAGLPCRRRGKNVDIEVAKADAWEISEADARAADRAAHKGRGR